MGKLFLGILLVMFWFVQTGEAHVTYINGKAVIVADQVNVSEDGSIGISSTQERFIFDGSGNLIKVTGANFQLLNAGSNQNSYKLMLLANNGGTTQTGSIFTAYGADPYVVIAVPNDAGTETQVLGIHDTNISLMTDNTVDLGSLSDNRLKNLFLAGYAMADSLILDSENRDVKLYRSAANILYTPDTLSVGGRVYLADDQWIGLGAVAGRIEFDDQSTDEVNILNANVGIGTTTPGAKLEVVGDVNIGNGSVVTSRVLNIQANMTTGPDTTGKSILRLSPGPASPDVAPSLIGYKIGDGSSVALRDYGLKLQVTDSNVAVTAVTIDNSGNVGIGTSTFGTSLAGGLAMAIGTAATTSPVNAAQVWVQDYAAGDARWYFMGEGSTNKVSIGNGKVDIVSVDSGVDVPGSEALILRNTNGTTNNLVTLDFEGSTEGAIGNWVTISALFTDRTGGSEDADLLFGTIAAGASAERWRITSAGILQSNGAQTIQTSSGNLTLTGGSSGKVLVSDSLGVGMTPTALLELVADNAIKPNGGSWSAPSDRRVKENIRPFKDGLQVLDKINPVWYQYNGKGGTIRDGKDYISVIANDVQVVAPYTVQPYKAKLNKGDRKETELLQFNNTALIYVTINAVKELEAITQGQQAQIITLEKRVKALEAKKRLN